MMGRFGSVLIGLTLLVGTTLTCWGLAHLQWPQALPWSDQGAITRYASFLIICSVVVFAGSWWCRKSALLIGGAVAAGFALLAGALWPLFVTLWFAVASALMGRYILTILHIRANEDNWLTNFLVGAGVYGTAVGLIAHFPVSYPGIYGIALALPLILSWRVAVEEGRKLLARPAGEVFTGFKDNKLDIAIAVVALIYFIVALMPEVGFDALAMHLFIPVHLATRHLWGFDAGTYVWAVMPMLGDWIFSIGYMLGGETAARLINVGFILVLARLCYQLVCWAGGSSVGGRWAVLIFMSTPLTFTEGNSLFIESVWSSFVVAATLAILSSCAATGRPKYELPVAGLLIGYAMAAKAVTFTILPVLLLLLVWRYKTWYKTVGSSFLILGTGLFLATGIIPYATAWWITGNPVFPLFNKIFQSPYFGTSANFDNPSFSTGLTWDVLYRVTFESGKYLESSVGASGFQWLLLFIPTLFALLAYRQIRGVALLLIGSLTIAVVFHSQSYLRYAFPSWVILSATIGVALSVVCSMGTLARSGCYVAAILSVILNLLFFSAGTFNRDFELKSILSETNRGYYLRDRMPIRNAVVLVNHLNIGRTPVAVFSDPLTAGLSENAIYPNWYNNVFQEEISSIQTEQNFADVLLKRNVEFVILDLNWNGAGGARGEKIRNLIEKTTEKLVDYGSISVRKIKTDYLFKNELLSNTEFTSTTGWVLSPDAIHNPIEGVILVSASASARQAAPVSSGGRYLNSAVARCAKEPTLGRVQINWIDIKGQYVSTDIKTFECSSAWAEYRMEVMAPANAAIAMVYVSGHTPIPLEFKSNSLRQ